MISVEEAKSILINNTFKQNKICNKTLDDCSGFFISEDLYSDLDLPPFNQSNVDGYAISFSEKNIYKVTEEIKAGDSPKLKLKTGEAARIFTGAVVPEGADCVVMQENVTTDGKSIVVNQAKFTKGEFIRLKGSQIKKGELAVAKGTYITPAVVGFLAALGLRKVSVYRKPVLHLLITGNELQTPGKKLRKGKVYESNSYMIESALKKMDLPLSDKKFISDDKDKLKRAVSMSLKKADVVLISGGVSVGNYDFVESVLESLGVTKLFHRISQRPGKPLYFGKKKNTYVFGLPGNPASVFTCFYEYVYPMLRKFLGFENYFLTSKFIPVLRNINKNFNLSNFLKAKEVNGTVESLEGQASYIIKGLIESNCFIYLPKDVTNVRAGENVEVHLLP